MDREDIETLVLAHLEHWFPVKTIANLIEKDEGRVRTILWYAKERRDEVKVCTAENAKEWNKQIDSILNDTTNALLFI